MYVSVPQTRSVIEIADVSDACVRNVFLRSLGVTTDTFLATSILKKVLRFAFKLVQLEILDSFREGAANTL